MERILSLQVLQHHTFLSNYLDLGKNLIEKVEQSKEKEMTP